MDEARCRHIRGVQATSQCLEAAELIPASAKPQSGRFTQHVRPRSGSCRMDHSAQIKSRAHEPVDLAELGLRTAPMMNSESCRYQTIGGSKDHIVDDLLDSV